MWIKTKPCGCGSNRVSSAVSFAHLLLTLDQIFSKQLVSTPQLPQTIYPYLSNPKILTTPFKTSNLLSSDHFPPLPRPQPTQKYSLILLFSLNLLLTLNRVIIIGPRLTIPPSSNSPPPPHSKSRYINKNLKAQAKK
jgi:hypothetical protein